MTANRRDVMETPEKEERSGNIAMNDTIKVKRSMSRLSEEERSESGSVHLQLPVTGTCSDINDLRKVSTKHSLRYITCICFLFNLVTPSGNLCNFD